MRLLRHPARKQSGPILHPRTHTGGGDPLIAAVEMQLQ